MMKKKKKKTQTMKKYDEVKMILNNNEWRWFSGEEFNEAEEEKCWKYPEAF